MLFTFENKKELSHFIDLKIRPFQQDCYVFTDEGLSFFSLHISNLYIPFLTKM